MRMRLVHSRQKAGDINMWGKLVFDLDDRILYGWIVDSWTWNRINPTEHLPAEMHWVDANKKFYRMRFAGDIHPTLQSNPEDKDIDPRRKAFITATLAEWEKEWIEAGSPMEGL